MSAKKDAPKAKKESKPAVTYLRFLRDYRGVNTNENFFITGDVIKIAPKQNHKITEAQANYLLLIDAVKLIPKEDAPNKMAVAIEGPATGKQRGAMASTPEEPALAKVKA